jgi:hypothetical protein
VIRRSNVWRLLVFPAPQGRLRQIQESARIGVHSGQRAGRDESRGRLRRTPAAHDGCRPLQGVATPLPSIIRTARSPYLIGFSSAVRRSRPPLRTPRRLGGVGGPSPSPAPGGAQGPRGAGGCARACTCAARTRLWWRYLGRAPAGPWSRRTLIKSRFRTRGSLAL